MGGAHTADGGCNCNWSRLDAQFTATCQPRHTSIHCGQCILLSAPAGCTHQHVCPVNRYVQVEKFKSYWHFPYMYAPDNIIRIRSDCDIIYTEWCEHTIYIQYTYIYVWATHSNIIIDSYAAFYVYLMGQFFLTFEWDGN